MAKCKQCGKATTFGHRVAHSKLASRRTFRPNLQRATIMLDGRRQQVTLCTKCIKALAKVA